MWFKFRIDFCNSPNQTEIQDAVEHGMGSNYGTRKEQNMEKPALQ